MTEARLERAGAAATALANRAEPRAKSRVRQRLLRDPVTLAAIAVLTIIVLLAILAPWVTTGEPYKGGALLRLKPIGSPGHWLGTDEVGRDMWTRLAYGGRLSLISGVVPVAVALLIGGSLGMVAGYAGKRINSLIMRTMDLFYAFPSVLLAIAVGSLIGGGIVNTVVTLAIVFVPPLVRVTESVTTRIRNMDFVETARASGAPAIRIIQRHLIPNILGPILVYATSLASLSIVLAAGLSFLGLGLPPPNAEWGEMLNALRQSIYVDPVLAALPGLMIFLTSVSFNLISDGLRNAMDVRSDV